MHKRVQRGLIILGIVFAMLFSAIIWNYAKLISDKHLAELAEQQNTVTLSLDISGGNIYDRNMNKLVNTESEYIGIAVPQEINHDKLVKYAYDAEDFEEKYQSGLPFEFECTDCSEESEGLTIFEVPRRYSKNQTACHVIGYTADNAGVTGIEYSCNSILRSGKLENSVTYNIDGLGRVLIGEGKSVVRSGETKNGVVLTLDKDIQAVCEEFGDKIDKGAIVVADAESGDILGLASYPLYDIFDLESALKDERSPLINRAFYSYSVGSIFKLVTACEAINEGVDDFVYDCVGSIDVMEQKFNCHKLEGHGVQNLTQAMVNSCNTYFIALSDRLDVNRLHDTAKSLGFGKENLFCRGMESSGGVLPTADELGIPAELANFSFGQGKLTASPIQITRLACTIANGGRLPEMRLIKSIVSGNEFTSAEKTPQLSRVMSESTAKKLRDMMFSAVYRNPDSNARPLHTSAGVKTSTAQTGRFDKNGSELCNAWITGFFPAFAPKYAVTVLVEDGGYGNDSSAPIFREIADKITKFNETH